MQPACELWPRVYRQLMGPAADEEALLVALWPVVVGPRVANRARPVRLMGETLVVEVAPGEWRRQLAAMRGSIVERLNAAAGRMVVRKMVYRAAPRLAPLPPGRAASSTGQPRDEAEEIRDPYLRRLYRRSRRRAEGK